MDKLNFIMALKPNIWLDEEFNRFIVSVDLALFAGKSIRVNTSGKTLLQAINSLYYKVTTTSVMHLIASNY